MRSNRINYVDVLAHLTIIVTILGISRVSFLPIAPHIVLSYIACAIITLHHKEEARKVLKAPEFIILTGCIVFSTAYDFFFLGVNDELLGVLGRHLSGLAVWLTVSTYGSVSSEKIIKIWQTCWIMVGLSCVWFLCEVFIGEPFIGFRERMYPFIYHDMEGLGRGLTAEGVRCGFSPSSYVVGYHVSVLACFALPILMLKSNVLQKNLAFASLIIGFVAASLSSQRSALVAFFVAVLWLSVVSRRFFGMLLLTFVVGGAGFLTYNLVDSREKETYETLQKPLWEKIQDPDHWIEVSDRVQLQVKGFGTLFRYPEGLRPYGLTYMDVNQDAAVSVHNHYLARGTQYGLLYYIMIISFIFMFFIRVRRVIKINQLIRADLRLVAVGSGLALFGLLFICASTHHGGILSDDAATVVVLAIFMAVDMNWRKFSKQVNLGHGGVFYPPAMSRNRL